MQLRSWTGVRTDEPRQLSLMARALAEDLHELPESAQQAYRYLFARVAAESGAFALASDRLPEPGMRLVLRDPSSGRFLIAERPAGWTREEEERYVAEMRTKLLGQKS